MILIKSVLAVGLAIAGMATSLPATGTGITTISTMQVTSDVDAEQECTLSKMVTCQEYAKIDGGRLSPAQEAYCSPCESIIDGVDDRAIPTGTNPGAYTFLSKTLAHPTQTGKPWDRPFPSGSVCDLNAAGNMTVCVFPDDLEPQAFTTPSFSTITDYLPQVSITATVTSLPMDTIPFSIESILTPIPFPGVPDHTLPPVAARAEPSTLATYGTGEVPIYGVPPISTLASPVPNNNAAAVTPTHALPDLTSRHGKPTYTSTSGIPSTFATRTKPMPSFPDGGEKCTLAPVSGSFVPVCNGITIPLPTGTAISLLEPPVTWPMGGEKRQEISITKTVTSLAEATFALPASCHAIPGKGHLVLCSDVPAVPTGLPMGHVPGKPMGPGPVVVA